MVKVLIPRERDAGETRVASSPEVVKRLTGRHVQCRVERGAGQQAGFSDEAYAAAGAELVNEGDNSAWAESDIVLSPAWKHHTTTAARRTFNWPASTSQQHLPTRSARAGSSISHLLGAIATD